MVIFYTWKFQTFEGLLACIALTSKDMWIVSWKPPLPHQTSIHPLWAASRSHHTTLLHLICASWNQLSAVCGRNQTTLIHISRLFATSDMEMLGVDPCKELLRTESTIFSCEDLIFLTLWEERLTPNTTPFPIVLHPTPYCTPADPLLHSTLSTPYCTPADPLLHSTRSTPYWIPADTLLQSTRSTP